MSSSTFKIILFGDSLVNIPFKNFGLSEKIRAKFPEKNLEIINAGVNGHTISYLRARLDKDVLSLQPNAVLLLWDSDVSNFNVETLDSAEIKRQYEEDINYVLNSLKRSCTFLSVSGKVKIYSDAHFPPSRAIVNNNFLIVRRAGTAWRRFSLCSQKIPRQRQSS